MRSSASGSSGSHEVEPGSESLAEIQAHFLPKPFYLRDLVALVESLTGSPESREIAIDRDVLEYRRAT